MKTVTLLSVVVLLAGCGGVAPVTSLPPHPDTIATVATLSSEPVGADGSASPLAEEEADEAALRVLHELSFNGLSPDGYHIAGVIAAPDSAPTSTIPLESGLAGGTEALAGPAYDIDVESFSDHQRVRYYVNYFSGRGSGRFNIWLGRMHRYEGMIRATFRRYGLAEDMVYLALIESGFSNTAVSRVNAVGMWQFMSYAGRPYGLRVDNWVDQRRDPFMATDAAARHLRDLNDRFGSWYLSAAAYNGGVGRVSRGIRRLGAQDSTSDETFFDLSNRRYIRRETRDYVPKLIAAAMIAKEPQRYGFDSIPLVLPLVFDEVSVSVQTGLDVLATLADTTTASLLELNPAYYRGATPPNETSVVRVPRGAGSLVAEGLAMLPDEDRVNFLEHRIGRGETLSVIAQRYRVSVSLIMAANPGLRPRRLRIGRTITIPVSPAARGGRVTPIATRRSTARPPVGPGARHRVARGESLWIIARRYNTTVRRLQELNDLVSGEVLRVGQQLLVGGVPGTHRVRRGESLWIISQRYGIAHGLIRQWNGLQSNALLRVGQVLRLSPP